MGICSSEFCESDEKTKRTQDRSVTIAVLGLENSGKTLISRKLQGDQDEETSQTIGVNQDEFYYGRNRITLYDLGGGPKIRSIWKNYFYDVHAVIYVIDSLDVKKMTNSLKILKSLICHPALSGKPFLILINKQDHSEIYRYEAIYNYLDLTQLSTKYKTPCRLEAVSALYFKYEKTCGPMKRAFGWLMMAVTENYYSLNSRVKADVSKLKNDNKIKKTMKKPTKSSSSSSTSSTSSSDSSRNKKEKKHKKKSKVYPSTADDFDYKENLAKRRKMKNKVTPLDIPSHKQKLKTQKYSSSSSD